MIINDRREKRIAGAKPHLRPCGLEAAPFRMRGLVK